jgi:hypothetical protein
MVQVVVFRRRVGKAKAREGRLEGVTESTEEMVGGGFGGGGGGGDEIGDIGEGGDVVGDGGVVVEDVNKVEGKEEDEEGQLHPHVWRLFWIYLGVTMVGVAVLEVAIWLVLKVS